MPFFRTIFIISINLVVLYVTPALASAASYYVAPNGGGSCSSTSPCSLNEGLNKAGGGDEVVLRDGVYYGQFTFSGGNGAIIRAERKGGAIISGMWEAAAKGQVQWRSEGSGIYSASYNERPLFGADASNTFLPLYNNLSDLSNASVNAKNPWTGSVTIKMPKYGLAYQGGRLYVRLPSNANPNGQELRFSSPPYRDSGKRNVFNIKNAPNVKINGIVFEGSGGDTCLDIDSSSSGARIDNVVFRYCYVGIALPNNSVVNATEYSYPGFGNFVRSLFSLNSNNMRYIYDFIKSYHIPRFSDTVGANLYEGSLAVSVGGSNVSKNVVFSNLHVHDSFDGLRFQFEDSQVRDSRFVDNYDNHVEMEHTSGLPARNLSLLNSTFTGVSEGAISHQDNALKGPQYVKNSVICFNHSAKTEQGTIKIKAPNASSGIFYENNTIVIGDDKALFQSGASGKNNFYFKNNTFYSNKSLSTLLSGAQNDGGNVVNNGTPPAGLCVGGSVSNQVKTPGSCSLYPSGSRGFSPYGLHWDWTTAQKDLLLKATCSSANTTIDIGNGREVGTGTNMAGLTYVYHQGYYSTGSGWLPYALQCSDTDKTKIAGVWCKGSATTFLPSNVKWFVGYTCIWTGSKWQCGCSDATCATSYWQVQGINR